jgi:hypothetical protein
MTLTLTRRRVPIRRVFGGVLALVFAEAAEGQWTAIRIDGANSLVYGAGPGVQAGVLNNQPAIWHGGPGGATLLGDREGVVYGVSGEVQVGMLDRRATLWHGTAESRVDLHPFGEGFSYALGAASNQQVGEVTYGGEHAALWRGTAASFVDLHPSWADRSTAYATDGTRQGGSAYGWQGSTYAQHAYLWNGSALDALDLSPHGTEGSCVLAMAAGVQVGCAHGLNEANHAALWRGTPESWVDLDTPGSFSVLNATTGTIHVGVRSFDTIQQAAANFGSAETWVNLHQFLPAGYSDYPESAATSVFQIDSTVYVGGWALSDNDEVHAFMWIGQVPAPGVGASLLMGALIAARRKRR